MAHDTNRMVLDALPAKEQAFWQDGRNCFFLGHDADGGTIGENLGDPDGYAAHAPVDSQAKAAPYALEIMGVPFHYFWVEAIGSETTESGGTWQTDTEQNWRFIMDGFDYYLAAVVRCAKAGNMRDAAGFMNWLCHVFQDNAGFMHALHGPAGVHPFMFNEFFPPPPDLPHGSASAFLGERVPDVDLAGYRPQLLGSSVAEAAFHLYHRYREVNRHSRHNLIPLIQSSYARDQAGETAIRAAIATKLAELLMDIFHTVYCLATDSFADAAATALDNVDMTDLFPVEYPNHLGGCYGVASPIVKRFSLSDRTTTVPLRLLLEDNGERRPVTFDTGLGTGAHYEYVLSYGIPRGVYQRCELAVGLHAELGEKGCVDVTIQLDENILFHDKFAGASAAQRVAVDVARGGILRWRVRALTRDWHDSNNHVVWGAPTLIK